MTKRGLTPKQGFIETLAAQRMNEIEKLDDDDFLGKGKNYWLGEVFKERVRSAKRLASDADVLQGNEIYKSAITRYYYALYNSARGLVFYVNQGDDHQRHNVLPGHLPAMLPENAEWANFIQECRLLRNECDYEIYPDDRVLKNRCQKVRIKTYEFIQICEECFNEHN